MRGRLVLATGALVGVWILLAVVRGVRASASVASMAPYVYAPLTVVVGGALGWFVVRRFGARPVAVVCLVVAAYVAVSALLTDHPGRGTIGYANANAALAVQLIALGGVLAVGAGRGARPARLGWAGVLVGMVALLANDSSGATAVVGLVVGAIVLAAAVPGARRRWPAVAVSLVVCVAAVVTLIQLARRVPWPDAVLGALDPVRRSLWNEAWMMFRRASTLGFGPGGFAQMSPLARDEDTMSAHSLPLQVGAELGGVGLVLLTLLFLCGLAWAAGAPSVRASWVAVAGWTALAAHAFMDHLVEWWPVTLAAGVVIGVAWGVAASGVAASGVGGAGGAGAGVSPSPAGVANGRHRAEQATRRGRNDTARSGRHRAPRPGRGARAR